MSGAIRIGTSGWNYDAFQSSLYPADLDSSDWLSCYAKHFSTVEINKTFYNLPESETVQRWRAQVPDDFVFAVKASRYLTHMKKLNEPGEPLERLLDVVSGLGDKLGPILFQLPPNWHYDGERLGAFLERLPSGLRFAFELRDPDWLNEQAYERLSSHGAAFVIYDFKGRQSPRQVTADFVYLRLHGPHAKPYEGAYDRQALGGWAGALHAWAEQGKDVYCYFDNTKNGDAAQDARALQAMVS